MSNAFPDALARLTAFRQRLQQLGWTDGSNIQIDTRWGEDDVDRERKGAAELVALAPDIVLANGTLSVAELQKVSRTLPIVFAAVKRGLRSAHVSVRRNEPKLSLRD